MYICIYIYHDLYNLNQEFESRLAGAPAAAGQPRLVGAPGHINIAPLHTLRIQPRVAGDTTPCRMTGVTLHGVVSSSRAVVFKSGDCHLRRF